MGNKGSNTTTQNAYGTTTTAANDEAQRAYEDVMRRATDAANTPYQAYKGQEVAPINAQQTAGIGTLNQTVANNHPLSADDIQKYMNPYTNDVVNATQADFDVQNQRANSTVTGNAAAQGALGGDRVGVAQALTAEGQARAQAPVIAGLRSSAYNSGLGAAQQQQQFGFQSGLQGAQAQVGAGTLEQQNQQAKDTQKMTDFYRARGYDFQVAQWLAGIDTGVGSQMGGTSTNSTHGQTEGPSPNTFAQIAGLGLGALSFANRGGRIEADRARGGGVAGFAGGGLPTPYANDFQSWVPQTGLTAGHGAPSPPQVHAPDAPKQQGMSPEQIMKGVGGLGKAFGNSSYGDAVSDYAQDMADGDAGSFSEYGGGGSWRGGRVKRYASGGSPGGGLPWLDDASAGWYAPDLIPTVAGFGASTPAVQSRSEEPADIPGEFRLDDQAHRDWQGRVDRDTGRARTNAAIQQGEPPPELQPQPTGEVMLAQNDNGVTDRGISPRGNPRPLSAQEDMANAIHDDTVPAGEGSALGYAPEPRRGVGAPRSSPTPPAPDQQPPQGGGGILGGLGIHLTPELRQGLLQAGLAMMATKRGGPGSFLGAAGEGGLRGVAGYNASVQAQQEADQQQFKNQMAVDELGMKHETHDADMLQKPVGPNGELTKAWKDIQDYKGGMNEAQKANDQRAREAAQFERDTSPYKVDPKTHQVVPNDAVIDVTKKMAEAKRMSSSMDDETAGFLADRVLAGDTRALVGLGRGAQGAENLGKIQQMVARKAASGEPVSEAARSILGNAAQQAGFVTAERTQAQIMAKLSVYGRTAYSAMDLALKASDAVPRTQFPKVNEAVNAWKSNTGDPAIKSFGQAVETLTNEYARAVGGGHGTVTDKEHARDRLNTAQTPEQFRAVVDMMKQEIVLAEHAMPEARKQIQGIYNPKAGEAAPSIEGTAGAAAPHTFLPQGGDVKQNGWWYRKQPDGNYTAVGPAQ